MELRLVDVGREVAHGHHTEDQQREHRERRVQEYTRVVEEGETV